jgi:hypothetical protein
MTQTVLCCRAIERSNQFWTSYTHYRQNIISQCIYWRQAHEEDAARQLYAVITREKMTLLQMLVKREEQSAESGRMREEKFDASLQELLKLRRNELIDIVERHAGQASQLESIHQKLSRWSQQQEHNMARAIDKTLEAMSPVAIAKAQSILSSFELDLQGVLRGQSLAYQRQAKHDTSALSSSIRQAQGTVEEWLESIRAGASSTASIFEEHQEQLRAVSQHSQDLRVSLSGVRQALRQVHSELEVSLESLQDSRDTSHEAAAIISEAVLLLNATVLHHSRAHRGWDVVLHYVGSMLGDSGQSGALQLQWWLKRAVTVYEMSLRECKAVLSSYFD